VGGKGEMIKAPISLQDLRRKIYLKAKADSAGIGGVGPGFTTPWGYLKTTGYNTTGPESTASSIGLINLQVKLAGKPGTGKPYAGFDVAGVGNGLKRVPRQSPTLPWETVVPMSREKPKWRTHKGESTEAGHSGGTTRSSEEVP
jgi:hypothetical protein